MMRSQEIHARIAWPNVLAQLGVPDQFLRKRNMHGPCPGCGGHDRYFFDNKHGRGEFFCRHCHPKFGDGFELLRLVFGWQFAEARKRVLEAAGLSDDRSAGRSVIPALLARSEKLAVAASPPERVYRLRRDRCVVENCDSAVDYLAARGLWPLPPECSLKAHSTAEYWHEGRRVGRYPAIVADVVDVEGELVTCHVTYLQHRSKLTEYEPRKILSAMTDRTGCAVRLMPATDVLGIAEGIETALSAAVLDGTQVWAALNTSLLSKFEPPPGVLRLRIYADRDIPGLTAATTLMERLQGRVAMEIHIPPSPHKDWNDVLQHRDQRKGAKNE
jgi:putative DNA primase/helicase